MYEHEIQPAALGGTIRVAMTRETRDFLCLNIWISNFDKFLFGEITFCHVAPLLDVGLCGYGGRQGNKNTENNKLLRFLSFLLYTNPSSRKAMKGGEETIRAYGGCLGDTGR